MGAFTLTNGALLGGLAFLAAPVIAHLLQRRARKPIVFPSIAFLQQTAAQQSRLHKLRRLFLLFLRALALACVVLAFTRPVWWTAGLPAGERKAATATVFLVDASLSTSQVSSGTTVFDRIKAETIRGLDQLQSGIDVAAVVYAGDQTTSVFPRLTANLPELKTDVSRAAPTQGRADFPNAISLAARLLDQHNGPRRLVILTDRQSTNWKHKAAADASDLRLPRGVDLVLPELEVATESNVGLSDPAMQPELPRPGAEVEVSAVIRNLSDSTQVISAVAEWLVDQAPAAIGSQSVSIPERKTSPVTLAATVPPAEIPSLQWRLPAADTLAADNTLWLTSSTGSGLPVVIASDDSPDDAGTAAFYITRGLAPFDDESALRSAWAPRHVTASRLAPADLNDVKVLCLGYAGVIRQETAAVLARFVEAGGSLIIFAGDGPADRNVQLLDEAAKGLLAPWRLLTRVEAPRKSPIVVESGRWNSRWLRDFDEPSQIALREIAFRRVWQAGAPATDAETLLTFKNGQPAMGLRHFGRGQCLLVNFSPESTNGDLGKTGTFVALLQMLTSQLVHDHRDRTTFFVGDRITFSVPRELTGEWTLIDPAGATTSLPIASHAGSIIGPRASRAGIHQLLCDSKPVAAVAVNVDPDESDLRPLTVDQLRSLLGGPGGSSPETHPVPGESAMAALEGGRPLWGGFLLAGLGAIALELFLLGLWRR